MLRASKEVMTKCFPLYLMKLVVLWFRQLENGLTRTCNTLVVRFMRQIRVHISRPKSIIMLETLKMGVPKEFLDMV